MRKLKLYSRIECPLCEYAEELLVAADIDYEVVDIDDSVALTKQYHVRIPVLSNDTNELNWPFTTDQASAQAQELLNG